MGVPRVDARRHRIGQPGGASRGTRAREPRQKASTESRRKTPPFSNSAAPIVSEGGHPIVRGQKNYDSH